MNWETLQQIIRIVLYTLGGYFLGAEVAQGPEFSAAVGGILAIGAFLWFLYAKPSNVALEVAREVDTRVLRQGEPAVVVTPPNLPDIEVKPRASYAGR